MFTLAHVGINMENPREAEELCRLLGAMFSWETKEGNSSFFSGKGIEIMKEPYLGEKGHIAIGTEDVDVTMKDMKSKGIKFEESTQKKDAGGHTKAIYLKGDFGGFALHLVKVS